MSDLIFKNDVLKRWDRWDQGVRQHFNDYWSAIAKTDPEFKSVYMVVELIFGGDHVVRVCSSKQPIVTTSSIDGGTYAYLPAMTDEPGIDFPLNFGQQTASPRSISMSIHGSIVQPAALIRQGRILAGMAEVSLQVHGGDYDKRYVIMRGDMSGGVSFGREKEWVSVKISDAKITQKTLIPDVSADVDRWEWIPDESIGLRYPVVVNGFTKIPCVFVQSPGFVPQQWIVADGIGWSEVEVYVNGDLAVNGVDYNWTFEATQDGLGRACTIVEFTSPRPSGDSKMVHVTIETSGDKLGVVESIENLLSGYTSLGGSGLNPYLFAEAAGNMPGMFPEILINTSGEDATDVVSFIQSALLPSFPMVHLAYEGRGLGPIIVDRRNGSSGMVLEADKFPLLERASMIQEEAKESCFNSYEFRYQYDPIEDNMLGVVKRDSSNSPICSLSETMLGGRVTMGVQEAPYITDRYTADYVSDWYVSHFALPSYIIQWRCQPSVLFMFRRGQNITYRDSEVGFDEVVATVEKISYKRGDCSITLRVWHPAWNTVTV